MTQSTTPEDAIDGSATELPDDGDTTLPHDPGRPAPNMALEQRSGAVTVAPQVEASELVRRLDVIKQAADQAMERDVDYGVIPGTDKPTLYKPGAEKLGVLFQLDVQIENEKTLDGRHLTVSSKATVYSITTGARLGFGEGMCSTHEKKYATRKLERVCPACGESAVIKGKQEYGGGWLCWKRKDGCGAKFDDGDPSIESQEVGTVENPDLPDLWNTVVKMAQKRARIDAVLAVTGASAVFTQDMDDKVPRSAETGDNVTPHGEPANDDSQSKMFQALAALLDVGEGPNEAAASGVMQQIEKDCGYVPRAVSRSILFAAVALRAAMDVGEGTDDPDKTAPEPEQPEEAGEEQSALDTDTKEKKSK